MGIHDNVAYYLLYNGILGDKRPQGGNVLTSRVLSDLPPHDGPKVIYGESSRISTRPLLNCRELRVGHTPTLLQNLTMAVYL